MRYAGAVITIDETLDVAAEPAAVFSVITRVERYPAWIPGVESATAVSGTEGTVGSRFRLRFAGPVGPIDADGEVTNSVAPSILGITGTSSLFTLRARCEVTAGASAGSSVVAVAGNLELHGLARFMEGQVRKQVAAGMPAALAQLRAAIEGEAGSAG